MKTECNQILLIWHPWDLTVARLSNILDYQTVPILTSVITGIFLLLLIYLDCTTNVRSIYFIWIYPSAPASGMSQSLSVFSGVPSVSTRDGGGPGDCRC